MKKTAPHILFLLIVGLSFTGCKKKCYDCFVQFKNTAGPSKMDVCDEEYVRDINRNSTSGFCLEKM